MKLNQINWGLIGVIAVSALWWALVICLGILGLLSITGCQTTKEVVHVECNLRDGEDAPDFYYYSEIVRTSFLYWNSAAGVTHTTPFTTVRVDKIETMPDANSLEAVADITGNIISKVVIP